MNQTLKKFRNTAHIFQVHSGVLKKKKKKKVTQYFYLLKILKLNFNDNKKQNQDSLAPIFQPAHHAQKLPHNIFNTKTKHQ